MADVVVNDKVVEGVPGYAIFFDNVRVDKFVRSFDSTLYTDGNIGNATIEMVYAPDFYKVYKRSSSDYSLQSSEHGIENMTNVKIFVKNMFSGKYVQVFDGNIKGKTFSKNPSGQYSLYFSAQDYLTWLNRTITPIAIPLDESITPGDQLKWKAHGIDVDKVPHVVTMKDTSFKGKNLSQTLKEVIQKTINYNKAYNDTTGVAYWDDVVNRLILMGDIDENLRKAEVLDFIVTSGATAVSSIYVMINDIIKNLMFEFYQDRDGMIRIKPPYWNQKVLYDHVIDLSLIESFTESVNWGSYFTRIVVTGGVEQWLQDQTSDTVSSSIVTPIGAYIGKEDGSDGKWAAYTLGQNIPSGGGNGGGSSGLDTSGVSDSPLCQYAITFVGKKYVWGGESPEEGGWDCSGLMQYIFKQFGVNLPRVAASQYHSSIGVHVSKSDLQSGDVLYFNWEYSSATRSKGPTHTGMYVGGGKMVHARNPDKGICLDEYGSYWQNCTTGIKRYTGNMSNGSKTPIISTTAANATSNYSSTTGDNLLTPSDLEKKYGISIYDVNQPLIKFSTAGSIITDPTGSAAAALKSYASFMFNLLNSATEVATVQTVAMPQIRPGFNVWLDPIGIDKIYYVNSITHQGTAESGTHTTLRLAMGRDRIKYANKKVAIGDMKDSNDNIFINKVFSNYKVEKFGRVLGSANEFNTFRKQCINFHNTDDVNTIKADNCRYFANLYGSTDYANKGTSSVASSTTTTTTASSVIPDVDKWPVLRKGSNSKYVNQLQNALKKLGYMSIKTTTNYFGSITYAAVKKFQSAKKIAVDGMVGPITRKKLKEALGGTSTSTTTTSKTKVSKNNIMSLSHLGQLTSTIFTGEYTLDEIQGALDKAYSTAPRVIKNRAAKIKSILKSSDAYVSKHYIVGK
jgi:cell wall-associated NlpC family hydrolase